MHLIWFRQDLRIQDQTALHSAAQSGTCIALVCLSPAQSQLHNDAPAKQHLYFRRIIELQKQLNALNIPLLCIETEYWSELPSTIRLICKKHDISTVHWNKEAGLNEQNRDAAVEQELENAGIKCLVYNDRSLFPWTSIRNKSSQPYQVFGAFKKQCYMRLATAQLPSLFPTPIKQQAFIEFNALNSDLSVFEPLFHFEQAIQFSALWPESDLSIQQRLDDFIHNQLSNYHLERDLPNIQGSSLLSPYLNIGALSIRQCLAAAFRESFPYFEIINAGQQCWLDELLWREFYSHLLYEHPKLSKHRPYKAQTEHLPWRDDSTTLNVWQTGQTGIPIVDAGMRQLLTTGWMHNRVRMICAMFFSKNLFLDWRSGEAWFMQHLIDGDLSANNGGWQWCASTGTDSVPYFRIFNPVTQSQKFDPDGEYIRRFVPELAKLDNKQIHEPYAKNTNIVLDYPQPIVDLKQSRLAAIENFKKYT
jgi:deoxyribodipyrimidine photo-lyase